MDGYQPLEQIRPTLAPPAPVVTEVADATSAAVSAPAARGRRRGEPVCALLLPPVRPAEAPASPIPTDSP